MLDESTPSGTDFGLRYVAFTPTARIGRTTACRVTSPDQSARDQHHRIHEWSIGPIRTSLAERRVACGLLRSSAASCAS